MALFIVDFCDQGTGGGGSGTGTVTSVSGTAPNVIITGVPTVNPTVSAGTQSWEFSGILTTPMLSNYQNDYTQVGINNITTLRILGDPFDPPLITGIQGGTDGRILIVHNISQDTPIYFSHDDPLSTFGNQFFSPGFVAPGTFWSLPINGMATFQYDATDQHWRVIGDYVYDVIDNGNTVVTVSGDNSQKVVGFNGVYVNAPLTGNGTSFSPITMPATSDVLENLTYFVDPVYGNDGTAVANSRTKKWETVDAAITAAGSTTDALIYLMPGAHNIISTHTVSNVLNIYLSAGAELNSFATPSFSIDPGQFLKIYGDGSLTIFGELFANNSASSSAIPHVFIRCQNINSTGAGGIGDFSSMYFDIEANRIGDRGIYCKGWCFGTIKCDEWVMSSGSMVSLDGLDSNDGETKLETNGPQMITVKGRNQMKCKYLNSIAQPNGIYTLAGRWEDYKTQIILNVDFDSTDGFFVNQGRGMIIHNGNLWHRKSNTAGNEVPWYYQQQDTEEAYKPRFIHQNGVAISATNVLFSDSQNNEIYSLAYPCIFELNGQYQNQGSDDSGLGLGARPILQFQSNSSNVGETKIILNGDFKSPGGQVAPIKRLVNGTGNNDLKLIVKNTNIQTRYDYAIESVEVMNIYVLNSLSMNVNYNANISDGMSEDRTMVDTNVEVTVPGYGV